MVKTFFYLLFLVIISADAKALDVFSVYSSGCSFSTGVIIQVDEDKVQVLNLDGRIDTIDIGMVETIAKYSVLENPIPRISAKKTTPLFRVISDSNEKEFLGFATNFLEGLVIFLDVDGKSRVLEQSQIVSIKSLNKTRNFKPAHFKAAVFSPPNGKRQCQKKGLRGNSHVPNLVVEDKLRLDSFWQGMQAGYRKIEGLKERTMFYGRPILVGTKSRLGLFYAHDRPKYDPGFVESMEDFPLYFEFGGGDPYRFQSHLTFGGTTFRTSPFLRSFGGFRSEFKSHLIHGELLANLSGLAAGQSLYKTLPWAFTDTFPDLNMQRFKHSINHMTLLGADYRKFSLSYGYYFPVFYIFDRSDMRQVLPQNTSPVLRLKYIEKAWFTEVLVFYTKSKGDITRPESIATENDQLQLKDNLITYYSENFQVNKAKIENLTLRFNFDWELNEEFTTGASFLFTDTKYEENSTRYNSEAVLESDTVTNEAGYQNIGLRAFVRMDMGKWVALRGEAHLEEVRTFYKFSQDKDENNDSNFQLYAAFELLL